MRSLALIGCLVVLVSLGGCVARSAYVDQLAQQQSTTADTVAYIAKSHADLATELQSPIAPSAQKLATIAEIQSADANDFKDISSGVNIAPLVNSALSGNWMELGMGLLFTAGLAFGGQQMRKASIAKAAAYEAADLEPVKAREMLRAKKV